LSYASGFPIIACDDQEEDLSMNRRGAILLGAILAGATAGGTIAAETPAKVLFGKVNGPALEARAIGSYARGCLAGAIALPVNGPAWQAMRLSRNRNWGTPQLVAFMERFAVEARDEDGWPGLLVGDMSQPRGGPMLTGHASHQIGLDADIWLTPMPPRTLTDREREDISATTMVIKEKRVIDRSVWTDSRARLIRRAARQPEVSRIFVNAAIKKALCDFAGTDRAWLRKVRPWWGHDYHFHVRLACPPGFAGCKDQDSPPPGDGCGAELESWLKPPPPPPKNPKPAKPKPELTLKDLPADCSRLVNADARLAEPVAATAVPLPREKP
jgi:penicillin-insensitive murein endopeptidase